MSRDGWCYGPVLCDRQPDGSIVMTCVDWASPDVPCPWTHTTTNAATAAIKGLAHAARH